MAQGIFTSITGKLERALRNQERAHLSVDEVRALYSSDAGRLIVLAARDEVVAAFSPAMPPPAPPVPVADDEERPEKFSAYAEAAAQRRCAQLAAGIRNKRKSPPN